MHGQTMRRILWKTIQDMDTDILINEPANVAIAAGTSFYTMNTPTRPVYKRKVNEESDIPRAGIRPSEVKRRRVDSCVPSKELSPRDKDWSQLLPKIANSHRDGKRWLQSSDVSHVGIHLHSPMFSTVNGHIMGILFCLYMVWASKKSIAITTTLLCGWTEPGPCSSQWR